MSFIKNMSLQIQFPFVVSLNGFIMYAPRQKNDMPFARGVKNVMVLNPGDIQVFIGALAPATYFKLCSLSIAQAPSIS